MAQYRNVKEFLDKINDKYKAHRAEYERLNELYNLKGEEWKKELARGWSNQQMQKEARAKHEAEQSEIRNALEELRSTANKDFENILCHLVLAFKIVYISVWLWVIYQVLNILQKLLMSLFCFLVNKLSFFHCLELFQYVFIHYSLTVI